MFSYINYCNLLREVFFMVLSYSCYFFCKNILIYIFKKIIRGKKMFILKLKKIKCYIFFIMKVKDGKNKMVGIMIYIFIFENLFLMRVIELYWVIIVCNIKTLENILLFL